MRSILKYAGLVAFCSLFLMFSGVSAQDNKSGKSGDAVKSDKSAKTETVPKTATNISDIEFPDVEGWEKDEIFRYPTKELGYSVNYESEEAGRVTVYVYNAGLKSIAADINDKAVKNEFDRARSDIKKAGEAGVYEDLKELKNETIMLGGSGGKVNGLYSLFSLKARGQSLSSEIYLFTHLNHFIKIRATRLKEDAGTENKALTKLLAAIGASFSK